MTTSVLRWPRIGRGSTVGCVANLSSVSRESKPRSSGNPSVTTEYGQVHIVFQVHKCCEFGRRVAVVGSLPGLGSWSSLEALPLEWNDGHIWTGSITVPLDDIIRARDGSEDTISFRPSSVEYKYIVQSSVHPLDESQVEWMPGDNLHIPALEYGTTALTVQDTWGYGYREIQFERMAEERMREMIVEEELSTKKVLDSMAQKALGELSTTLTYCESLMSRRSEDDPASTIILDADRELAASSDRAIRMLRANQALYYMDGV